MIPARRFFVTGGTGSIGAAVVALLCRQGHAVTALARSDASATNLQRMGATPLRGDLAMPAPWIGRVPVVDAVLHMAADFGSDMGGIEAGLLDALLPTLGRWQTKPRVVYTGGCWLFGARGDALIDETTPFEPLPAFAWMVGNARRVLTHPDIQGIVIHPAMVYAADGGVFRRMADDARQGRPVRVVGSPSTRWTLVHRDDLAALYVLAATKTEAGSSYCGSAIDGVAIGDVADALARRFRSPATSPAVIRIDEAAQALGEWARGLAMDQRMSGAKARRDLGWQPRHLDAIADIEALPDPR